MSAAPTPGLGKSLNDVDGHEDVTMRLYAINVDDEVLQS